MFYTKFCELANNKNSTPTRVVMDLGMSKGNLDRWKKGGVPSVEILQKIASYFDVSIDYLLGTEKKATPQEQPLDDEKQQLINRVKKAKLEHIKKALDYLDLLENQKGH